MDSHQMISAVEAWAVATIPDLSSFDFPPEDLAAALPIALAEVMTDVTEDTDTQLPGFGEYEQTFLRVWNVDLILLVNPDPAWTATYTLYDYVDALKGALLAGVSLAPQVALSKYYNASYDPPEMEYADGTVARQVTIRLIVGEMIGA